MSWNLIWMRFVGKLIDGAVLKIHTPPLCIIVRMLCQGQRDLWFMRIVQITCWRKVFSRAIPSTMFYRGRRVDFTCRTSRAGVVQEYRVYRVYRVCGCIYCVHPKKVLYPDLRWDSILTSRTETETKTPPGGVSVSLVCYGSTRDWTLFIINKWT